MSSEEYSGKKSMVHLEDTMASSVRVEIWVEARRFPAQRYLVPLHVGRSRYHMTNLLLHWTEKAEISVSEETHGPWCAYGRIGHQPSSSRYIYMSWGSGCIAGLEIYSSRESSFSCTSVVIFIAAFFRRRKHRTAIPMSDLSTPLQRVCDWLLGLTKQ